MYLLSAILICLGALVFVGSGHFCQRVTWWSVVGQLLMAGGFLVERIFVCFAGMVVLAAVSVWWIIRRHLRKRR